MDPGGGLTGAVASALPACTTHLHRALALAVRRWSELESALELVYGGAVSLETNAQAMEECLKAVGPAHG